MYHMGSRTSDADEHAWEVTVANLNFCGSHKLVMHAVLMVPQLQSLLLCMEEDNIVKVQITGHCDCSEPFLACSCKAMSLALKSSASTNDIANVCNGH